MPTTLPAVEPVLSLATGRVEKVSETGATVTLSVDVDAAFEPRDPCATLLSNGQLWSGRILTRQDSTVVCETTLGKPPPGIGAIVTIIPRGAAQRMRDALPPGVTLRANIDRLSPGRGAGWIDAGARDGFRNGDRLLVLRRGIPIARLTLTQVYDAAALGVSWPLVANVPIAVGDGVELWPAPSDGGGIASATRVLDVRSTPRRTEIWIPGDSRDGLAVGQLWEIRRDAAYVDLVEILGFRGRFTIAGPSTAFARDTVQSGDTAIPRRAEDVRRGRAAARVFRQERGYCLLNVGEREGIEEGMPVFIETSRGAKLHGRIESVKPTYSGVHVEAAPATGTNAGRASNDPTSNKHQTTTGSTTRGSTPGDAGITTEKKTAAEVLHAATATAVTGTTTRTADDRENPTVLWSAAYLMEPPVVPTAFGDVDAPPDALGFARLRLADGAHAPAPGEIITFRSDPLAAGIVAILGKSHAVVFIPRTCGRRRVTTGLAATSCANSPRGSHASESR